MTTPKADTSVTCKGCGQTWPRDPALEVKCPKCSAGIGVLCSDRRPSDHRVSFGGKLHPERDQHAMDMGLLAPCPAAKPAPAPTDAPRKRVSSPRQLALI